MTSFEAGVARPWLFPAQSASFSSSAAVAVAGASSRSLDSGGPVRRVKAWRDGIKHFCQKSMPGAGPVGNLHGEAAAANGWNPGIDLRNKILSCGEYRDFFSVDHR
jgi:hypothetical protein